MTQRSLKSYDPLAYYVNTLANLDPDVVETHKTKDKEKKAQLLSIGDKAQLDVFICVDNDWHGAVLLAPSGGNDQVLMGTNELFEEDPSKIPSLQLCYFYDLRYENQQLRMYKISRKVKLFRDIEKNIKTSYFIGRYKDVPLKALDFAALHAAPHRYETLLNDCVSFAMEYCHALLSYCSNGLEIEAEVDANIKKASATGFSVEKLSRQNYLSGWMGNVSFGGLDVSSYLGGRAWFIIPLSFLFLTIYIVVVTLFVLWLTNNI